MDDCKRPFYGLGLCNAHYMQQRAGKPLTMVRRDGCNLGLGAFKDDVGRMERAIWYLKREVERRSREAHS